MPIVTYAGNCQIIALSDKEQKQIYIARWQRPSTPYSENIPYTYPNVEWYKFFAKDTGKGGPTINCSHSMAELRSSANRKSPYRGVIWWTRVNT